MDLSYFKRIGVILVVMVTLVVSVVMLVGEILDFADSQPIWLISGDYAALLDGFIAVVTLNSASILLAVSYMLYTNHCCPAGCLGNQRFGYVLLIGGLLVVGGHVWSIWGLLEYRWQHLPRLNDHVLRAFTVRLGVTDTMHYLEASLHCCGVNGPEDYHNISPLPDSCCKLGVTPDPGMWFLPGPQHAEDWDKCKRQVAWFIHEQGCLGPITHWMSHKTTFLLHYNYCAVAMVMLTLLWATHILAFLLRPLVSVTLQGRDLGQRALEWDVVDDWDQLCQRHCPVLLHIL